MAKKYDDFDDGDQNGFFDQILNIVSERKREFAIVSVSAAVLLLGLVVWGSYPDSADTGATESVPIVRADAGAYKTTPETHGKASKRSKKGAICMLKSQQFLG